MESQENHSISTESMSHLFSFAFDLIFAQWMNCKNYSNKIQIVNAIIMITTLMPDNAVRNNLENVVTISVHHIKKESLEDNIIFCKTFRIFFEAMVLRYRERLEVAIASLLL